MKAADLIQWLVRHLPGTTPTRPIRQDAATADGAQSATANHVMRTAQELQRFGDDDVVHNLPPIFSYWATAHLQPMVADLGFRTIEGFFLKYLDEAARRCTGPLCFLSIGAGNCDTENRLCQQLLLLGHQDFRLDCLEFNPAMLARGRRLAHDTGVAQHMGFIEADFNTWTAPTKYTAILANHSLHHVSRLEHLLDTVHSCLQPNGYFLINDVIGRNGHRRWPEALTVVRQLWRELPDSHHFNHQLGRQETDFVDHDCSTEGFEGIRAQDILPLLIERFEFALFVPFGNVVCPFIDRSFGPNFSADSATDRAFIDKAHLLDEEGFRSGRLTPTQMLAVLGKEPPQQPHYSRGLSPRSCVRDPQREPLN